MQLKLHMVTIEDLVPADHFLRKLASALDLSFVYEETAHMYCRRYGRPPIDPVVLVKYLLVGYLYGIRPSGRSRNVSPTASPCAGIWESIWTSECRIIVPSHSCADGNRRSARCSGGCLKQSCSSALNWDWPAAE